MSSLVRSLAVPTSSFALGALLLLATHPLAGAGDSAPPPPRISEVYVDSDTTFVTVEVAAGVERVVLEACHRQNMRGWLPIAVERLGGDARVVTFRIPMREPFEILRVRADAADPLPASYYRGRTNIAPVLISSGANGGTLVSPAVNYYQGGLSYLTQNGFLADATSASRTGMENFGVTLADSASSAAGPLAPQAAATREVVESDIWKLHGSRLYFFNQRRGLQVIDVADPSAPALLGTLFLPAAGDQLYVLDDQHVVLLVRDACGGNAEQSAAVVVDVSGPQPRELSRLPLPGRVVESRLVGTALYVASQTYLPAREDAAVWEWNTVLTALDLTDPTVPEQREGRTIAGNATAVAAEGGLLFVAVAAAPDGRPRSTQLQVFDISAENGTVLDFADIPLRGAVLDKFKLDLHGDVLRVVLEDQGDAGQRSPVTRLMTLQLQGGGDPGYRILGSLQLAAGESLFGTRFDGDRAYVVTYRRVDPLWVLDLSDPTAPRVAGELHIPGWSTYLHPLGDRLLTVGIDDTAGSRAAVQLFDVADPAHPALLSKVLLGQNWSSSEATENEKALSVFPEAGLALVPFQSSGQTALSSGLQLIDLGRDTLTRRGVVAHTELAPRRSTLIGNRVLSLSPRELLTVEIADRDRPQVIAGLELAPSVDRLLTIDPYLLKFSDRGLDVAELSQPNSVLGRTSLGTLPVLGAAIRDQRLYVLQGSAAASAGTIRFIPLFANDQTAWTSVTNDGRLQLTVFDLGHLPDVSMLGQISTNHSEATLPDFKALWPNSETLVWSAAGSPAFYPFWGPAYSISLPVIDAPAITFEGSFTVLDPVMEVSAPVSLVMPGGTVRFASTAFNLIWPGPAMGVRQALFAFDVSDFTHPRLSSIRHSGDEAAQASEAFTGDGLVLFSEEINESDVSGTNFVVYTETTSILVTNLVWRTNITAIPDTIRHTNFLSVDAAFPAITRTWSNPRQSAPVVAAGAVHNLLLDGADTLWTWGDTATRRAPNGALRDPAVPEPVAPTASITALSAGADLNLALDSSGSVWSWAAHLDSAPPPVPGEPPQPEPTFVPPSVVGKLPRATAISAGYQHALAAVDNAVWAWGRNEHGQLGDGDPLATGEPRPVPGLPGERVAAVAAGAFHSLALFSDGRVLAWGDNELAQFGGMPGRTLSAPVFAFEGAKAIAAGQAHSVALRADGTVWTWGRFAEGQLGRSQETSESKPQMVPGLPPIRAIAAGGFHTLALAEDGQVWIWGTLDPAAAPLNLPPLPVTIPVPGSVAAIASGRFHALAVTADGRTIAWGRDDEGQLGTGDALQLQVRGQAQQITYEIVTRYVTNVTMTTKIEYRTVTRPVTNAVPIVRWWQRHQLVALDYSADPADPLVRPPLDLPGNLRGVSHDGAMLYTVARRGTDGGAAAGRDVLEPVAYDGIAVFVGQGREIADVAAGQTGIVEVTPEGRVVVARGFADNQTPNRVELLTLDSQGNLLLQGQVTLAGYPQSVRSVPGLLAIRESSGVELFDLPMDGPPRRLPSAGVGCLPLNLDRLTGDATVGLWVPGGEYGAVRVGPE